MPENFGIKDIIDILLVAVMMYQLYSLVTKSGTAPVFKGVMAFIVLWILVSQVFQMRLMGAILDKFVSIGLLVIVIIFQDDIKRFLINLGANRTFKFLIRLFSFRSSKDESPESKYTPVILACMNMTKTYTGALIVIEQEISLKNYEETGEMLNADISTRLIENIFFKNTPLHDGALIIAKSKIKAAGCILPVSHSQDLPKDMGLRHRAALGMSQETDAKIIIVSEERGKISFASKGILYPNITPERLQELLHPSTGATTSAEK